MDNRDENICNHKIFKSALPYPEIKVLEPNRYYAELLMEDYAGLVSELTAINQYLYHSFIINEEDKYLIDMLKGISISEMEHLEILAELINLLGGNPVYRGSHNVHNNFWDASYVYYGYDIYDRLKADIDSEYKAIEHYEKDIMLINDPYIQAILYRIIQDEEVHISLFKEAIKLYCKKK